MFSKLSPALQQFIILSCTYPTLLGLGCIKSSDLTANKLEADYKSQLTKVLSSSAEIENFQKFGTLGVNQPTKQRSITLQGTFTC